MAHFAGEVSLPHLLAAHTLSSIPFFFSGLLENPRLVWLHGRSLLFLPRLLAAVLIA